ncbi:hypothetical protein Fmac_002283 [Flemingia macrophylla]|uniref:Uncharacterized protein n=1 Tax=Flemingia macrophylla TaxID=520843 RepID=A0ABD1NJG6_9FABA
MLYKVEATTVIRDKFNVSLRLVQVFHTTTSSTVGPSTTSASDGGALQHDVIQQMVLSVLSALGIIGSLLSYLDHGYLTLVHQIT